MPAYGKSINTLPAWGAVEAIELRMQATLGRSYESLVSSRDYCLPRFMADISYKVVDYRTLGSISTGTYN